MDLVESDHSALRNDPSYRETVVYGNVLIEHDVVENSQVLHYGGDSGDEPGFQDMAGQDYSFLDVSRCVDEGVDLPPNSCPPMKSVSNVQKR
ncbi:MAG: hypothetical protein SWH78_04660 [Thermodesulfobacteriota bacterium]|nr:hypothetical protein [Thermodesulfobacteriota bacterium]